VTASGSADWEDGMRKLTHSTSTPGGVLLARYARSGEVRTGAFEEGE
jgi:hypothetical protein